MSTPLKGTDRYNKWVTTPAYKKLCECRSERMRGDKNPNFRKSPSTETRKRISLSLKGKHLSNETRKKISDAITGEKNPNFGKPMSDKQRREISATLTGRHASEETCIRISVALTEKNIRIGKVMTFLEFMHPYLMMRLGVLIV